MTHSYLRDLAVLSLPEGGRRGKLYMLWCGLDDSGTHDGASVVTWGGVAGDISSLEAFEAAWKALLAAPCDNKPPIRKFHSYDLMTSFGEFQGYSQAERDRTRYNFRQAIVDAGLTWISFGASTEAYDRVMPANIREHLSLETFVFGKVVEKVCSSADPGEVISFHFDKGRCSGQLEDIVAVSANNAGIDGDLVKYSFESVVTNVGLQAADLVAHETYRYFSDFERDPNTSVDVHLGRLTLDVHDSYAGFFGEREIAEAYEKARGSIEAIRGRAT